MPTRCITGANVERVTPLRNTADFTV